MREAVATAKLDFTFAISRAVPGPEVSPRYSQPDCLPSILLTVGALASVAGSPQIEHAVDGRPYLFAGLHSRHAGHEQLVVRGVLMPHRRDNHLSGRTSWRDLLRATSVEG